jgi:hypothetical protein
MPEVQRGVDFQAQLGQTRVRGVNVWIGSTSLRRGRDGRAAPSRQRRQRGQRQRPVTSRRRPCDDRGVQAQRFSVTLRDGGGGRVLIPVPFDPDTLWGAKQRHHVGGTVNGTRVRGVVELHGATHGFLLGQAWLRDHRLAIGDQAEVVIEPEGPQRDDLAPDVAAALAASPRAGEFFDSLAQFYRRGYLRWIDATKRRPDLRVQRIAAMVELLERGVKDYHDQQSGS